MTSFWGLGSSAFPELCGLGMTLPALVLVRGL